MTGLSQASYRIELESGKSVITRYYWEEDGWVMFYQYDGVVGYPARLVRHISETDKIPPAATSRLNVAHGKEDELERKITETSVEIPINLEIDEDTFHDKVEQYQKELRNIHQETARLVNKYYGAMREDRQSVMIETRDRIQKMQKKQEEIEKKTRNLYEGNLPDWWFEIIEEI